MVTTEYSEFSYAFALVSELVARPGTGVRAPNFPTQNEEGEVGYDVSLPDNAIGVPLFFQFKRPSWLVSRRAGQWDEFGTDYFRFPLRDGRRGGIDQHGLLLELETRFPGQVLYAAARFSTSQELSDHFDQARVLDESFVVEPSRIGRPDGQTHHIAYSRDPAQDFVRCSEPTRIEKPSNEYLIDRALSVEPRDLEAVDAEIDSFLREVPDSYRLERTRRARRRADSDVRWRLGEVAAELRYTLNIQLLFANVHAQE